MVEASYTETCPSLTNSYIDQNNILQISSKLAKVLDIRVLVLGAVLPIQPFPDHFFFIDKVNDIVRVLWLDVGYFLLAGGENGQVIVVRHKVEKHVQERP